MTHHAKWIKASSDEPVVDVADRTLESRLEAVQHYLPLAAKKADQDIEHVHLVRVSSRRAQAALTMYWELLPEWRAAWMVEQLKHIRQATNDARDDDVFARRLSKEKKHPGNKQLLELVREHRKKSQKPVNAIFEKLHKDNRLERKIEKLLKRVRLRGELKNTKKKPSFGDWAPAHFEPVLNRFFNAAEFDKSDLEAFHQFRIAGKSVRYAMELLAGAFQPEFRDEVYPSFEKLQDKLGKLNDHVAARTRILRWIGETDSASPELEYLYEMLAGEKEAIESSSEDFFQWWTPKREARLHEAFDQVMSETATT